MCSWLKNWHLRECWVLPENCGLRVVMVTLSGAKGTYCSDGSQDVLAFHHFVLVTV